MRLAVLSAAATLCAASAAAEVRLQGAEVAPGQPEALSDLAAQPDASRWSVYLGADSYGKHSVGLPRAVAGLKVDGLVVDGDHLHLRGSATQGWQNIAFDYDVPFIWSGTRLFAGAEASRTDTIRQPFDDEKLLLGSFGVSSLIGAVSGITVEPYAVFHGFGETGVRDGTASRDETGFGAGTGLALRLAGAEQPVASVEVRRLRWDDGVRDESVDHLSISGRLIHSWVFADAWSMGVDAHAQWTLSGRAPHAYRVTISGPFAVRGYDGNLSGGDSGFVVRADFGRRLPKLEIADLVATAFVFADVGRPWERKGERLVAGDPLASIGVA